MVHNNTTKGVYPAKILLSVFIFALVILAGKIAYAQFTSISVSVANTTYTTELAAIESAFFRQKAIETGNRTDTSLDLYRNSNSQHDVLWFYTHITKDEKIAKIILENASKNNIPPSLAFALAWEESRYKINAINKNATSTDRGLFQLNNKAFPKLTEKDFFNPETNAHYGLSHLSYCIDLSGNQVAALAMYNAGTTKVRNDGTPKRTLDYISRILAFKDGLEQLFAQQVSIRYADPVTNGAQKK